MVIPASELKAGKDYPRDRLEFDTFFPDEGSCLAYLERVRWPDGFVCPRCGGSGTPWRSSRGLLVCSGCQGQTSVLAGTIFHRTRTPLRTWFLAAWEITSHKHGATALGIQRVLGLKSYQTAWAWLHKFRRAMVRPERDRLKGIVEIDEAYVGGLEEGARGRYTETKAIVAIAVEILEDDRLGRVRMESVPDVSADALESFVHASVQPGSSVLTDGWTGYSGLTALGYDHVISTSPHRPIQLMCSCRESIVRPPCSSAGFSGPTRAGYRPCICRTISTSSAFVSTAEARVPEACSSTGSSNRPPSGLIRRRATFTKAPAAGHTLALQPDPQPLHLVGT